MRMHRTFLTVPPACRLGFVLVGDAIQPFDIQSSFASPCGVCCAVPDLQNSLARVTCENWRAILP